MFASGSRHVCCAHAHVNCCRLQVRRDGSDVDRLLLDSVLHPVRLRHGARVSTVRRRDRRAQADARLTSFHSRRPAHVVSPTSSRRVQYGPKGIAVIFLYRLVITLIWLEICISLKYNVNICHLLLKIGY